MIRSFTGTKRRCTSGLGLLKILGIGGVIAACHAAAMAPSQGLEPPPPAPLSVQSQVTETLQYDTNPLLLSAGARSVFGSVTEPEFTLTGATETLRLDWDNKIDVNEFDRAAFSSTDYHTVLRGFATGETVFAKLIAGYDYDTTRTSELATSGFNVAGIGHQGLTASPEIGVILTQDDQILFDGSYQRGIYDNTLLYTNFQQFSATPQFVHAFTEDDSGILLMTASRFETLSGIAEHEESAGLGLGWQRRISARLNVTASGGGNWTDSYVSATIFAPASSTRKIGYFYNLALNYTGEQDTIGITGSRNLLPEGVAAEAVQTSIHLAESHVFTPDLSANISATLQNNNYSGSDAAASAAFLGGTGQSLEADAGLSYRLTETLALSPTLRYRDKEFVGGGSTAVSRSALVTLVFSPHAAVLGW
jgi:hypothetical protein